MAISTPTGTSAHGSSTAPSTTVPGSPASGDYLLWAVCSQASDVAAPSGFTRLGTQKSIGAGSAYFDVFKKVATGSESGSFTGSMTSGNWVCQAVLVHGTNIGKDVDAGPTSNGTSGGGNAAVGSITSGHANELILIFNPSMGKALGGGAWTPDAALTELVDEAAASTVDMSIDYLATTTTGAYGGWTNSQAGVDWSISNFYSAYYTLILGENLGVTSTPKTFSATSTGTATMKRVPGKPLAATSTGTATMKRSPGKVLAKGSPGTATLTVSKANSKTFAATSAGVASLVKAPGKLLAVTSTGLAAMVRSAAKVLAATSTGTPSMVRSAGKILAKASTTTATGAFAHINAKTFAATSTGTALLTKAAGKVLAATSTGAASMVRSPVKVLAATSTGAATMTRRAGKALAVTSTGSASLVKRISKTLAATVSQLVAAFAQWVGQDKGLRVDVYAAGASPARLAVGPITQVLDFEYGNAVDRIGDAKLVLPATDPKVAYITDLAQLRIYRGGEGRVFVGRVREITTGQDASGMATTEVTLDDLAVDLAVAKTGLGLTLTDVSPAGMLSALLGAANTTAPTSFASGSVDSSIVTLRKRHDADDVWPAIVANAPVWSMHARHDSITNPAAPVVDLGAFGADSGLQFGIGQYPLQEIRKHRTGGALVNRIVGFGQGEGYPALSLKAASHGANLCTNPSFETDTSGWTGSGCSIARSAVQAKLGSYALLCTWTSGTGPTANMTAVAISGATAGRKWKVGGWLFGGGAAVGKQGVIFVQLAGGGGETQSTTFTIAAGWQYVTAEITAVGNSRTTVTCGAGINAGGASGDTFYIDRITLWESTYYAYCVETDLNPDGSSRYWIEDVASSAAYGVREDYRTVKVAYPISATKASWVGACDQVYDLCAEWLQLHTAALSTYEAKVLGLNHVSGGSQVVKVGDKSKLWFHGVQSEAGAATTTTLTLQVGADNDDGAWQAAAGGSWLGSGGASAIGDWDGALGGHRMYSAYVRFTNVTVAPGTTISAATLQLEEYSDNPNANTVNAIIRGLAEDNATAPTSRADAIARTRTTASVAVPAIGNWSDTTWYTSADISAIIQEIVNRPGWVSGNAIVLYLEDNGSSNGAYRTFYAHESSGAAAPKLNISYAAAAAPTTAAWLTVDALLWLMAYRRRVGAAGTNEWDLTLSSVDLHYMDAFARLAAQMQDYRGSGTELKQSNYTFAVTAEGYLGSGAPTGTPSSVYMAPAMRDILAIVKVTYVVIQVSGAAKNVDVTIQGSGVPGSSLNLATNVNVTNAVSYDVTQYFQQTPTPVPWADGSVGWGDINVLIALNSAGVGPWRYRTTLFFETTKIPLPPS